MIDSRFSDHRITRSRQERDHPIRPSDRPIARFSKLALVSLIVTCILMPLVLVALRFVRMQGEMRRPVARAVGVASIASGVSASEVIVVFLLVFGLSLVFSRRLLD